MLIVVSLGFGVFVGSCIFIFMVFVVVIFFYCMFGVFDCDLEDDEVVVIGGEL